MRNFDLIGKNKIIMRLLQKKFDFECDTYDTHFPGDKNFR